MVVLGALGVVSGGLVAALSDPLSLAKGSWLAAYLVLVCGVGQYVMGLVQARPEVRPTGAGHGWTQVLCWNVGNLGVVVGTLAGVVWMVDLSAVLLLLALGAALAIVSPSRLSDGREPEGRARGERLAWWAYRAMLLVLVVSLPVGVVLAHTGGGS
jgi:hypothetical protein